MQERKEPKPVNGRVASARLQSSTNHPEIAAMALADVLGRKLPEVVRFLITDHLTKEELEEGLEEGWVDDGFRSDF